MTSYLDLVFLIIINRPWFKLTSWSKCPNLHFINIIAHICSVSYKNGVRRVKVGKLFWIVLYIAHIMFKNYDIFYEVRGGTSLWIDSKHMSKMYLFATSLNHIKSNGKKRYMWRTTGAKIKLYGHMVCWTTFEWIWCVNMHNIKILIH